MENTAKNFTYNYSAVQQDEVKRIREKYQPTEPSKLEELRRLDKQAERAGTIPAVALGTVSTLVLGLGMSCCLVWADKFFIPGIILGVIGMIGIALAYPLNQRLVKKRREKLAPQILKLSEELTQG